MLCTSYRLFLNLTKTKFPFLGHTSHVSSSHVSTLLLYSINIEHFHHRRRIVAELLDSEGTLNALPGRRPLCSWGWPWSSCCTCLVLRTPSAPLSPPFWPLICSMQCSEAPKLFQSQPQQSVKLHLWEESLKLLLRRETNAMASFQELEDKKELSEESEDEEL